MEPTFEVATEGQNYILRQPDYTGDIRIDALLEGTAWGDKVGSGALISHSFPTQSGWANSRLWGDYIVHDSEPWRPDFDALSPREQSFFRQALGAWAEVANVSFNEVSDIPDVPDDGEVTPGVIRAAFTTLNIARPLVLPPFVPAGNARFPSADVSAGDIWLNGQSTRDFQPGGAGYNTMLHEIGHSLGLKHPRKYFRYETSDNELPESLDNDSNTLMSYLQAPNGLTPVTPMPFDILAMQHLYGVNTTTRAGDTSYILSDHPVPFGGGVLYPIRYDIGMRTIWDAGGQDSLNASQVGADCVIDLEEGAASSIGRDVGNIVIAFGAEIEDAVGGHGNDDILGNELSNALSGGDGADSISGRGGDDHLYGNQRRDTLNGGPGSDTLDGGEAADTADYTDLELRPLRASGVTIDLQAGVATLIGASEGWSSFRDYADWINTTAANNKDHLISIENATGSSGSDVISGDALANVLDGERGSDTLTGRDGDDNLKGGAGSDFLYGGGKPGSPDDAGFDDGDDHLDGGPGDDVLDGGSGDDSAYYKGSDGELRLDLAAGQAMLYETELDPAGQGGRQVGYYDKIIDIENVVGSDGVNWLYGTDGNNNLSGGAADDHLFGRAGLDTLGGGEGTDELYGEAENDRLIGGPGNDILNGGADTDTADYRYSNGLLEVDLEKGEASISAVPAGGGGWLPVEDTDVLTDIENVTGSSGPSNIYGNELPNVLDGLDGPNSLYGRGGNDTLWGGSDRNWLYGEENDDILRGGDVNDRLDGGTGADEMQGFGGDDVYVVDNPEDEIIEFPGEGTDRVRTATTVYPLPDDVENLELLGDVWLHGIGNDLDNILEGNKAPNALFGLGGNDLFDGEGGADDIFGGAGKDTLTGGADADRFWFSQLDTGFGRLDADVINDFSRWDGDRIDLSATSVTRFGGAGESPARNEVSFFSEGRDTVVRFNHEEEINDIVLADVNLTMAESDFVLL